MTDLRTPSRKRVRRTSFVLVTDDVNSIAFSGRVGCRDVDLAHT